MTAAALWTRIAGAVAGAGLLLALVPAPHRVAWPLAAAVPAGVLAGTALFAAVERRPPSLPRPWRLGARVWLGKHAVLALLAGSEEIVWRWGALGQLARVVPAGVALCVTAAGFALWHRPTRPEHLAAGLVFGGLFLGTGSLAAAWGAHGAYNAAVATADEAARPHPRGGAP